MVRNLNKPLDKGLFYPVNRHYPVFTFCMTFVFGKMVTVVIFILILNV